MAKVNITGTAPTGETFTRQIEDTEISTYRKKAEDVGYQFSVDAILTPEEESKVSGATTEDVSASKTAVGAFLQGLSLGSEDEIIGVLDDKEAQKAKESLRQRQEAEHPYIYGGAKFLGSLVPMGAGVASGAALGAAAGAPFGGIGAIPGAVIGGIGGGMTAAGLLGAGESYFSKPTPEGGKQLEAGDIGMGALSAGTEGVGRVVAPLARTAYRGARNKLFGENMLKGATEVAEDTASSITKQINAAKGTAEKIAINNQYATELGEVAQEMMQKGLPAQEKEQLKQVGNAIMQLMEKNDIGGVNQLDIAVELDLLGKQLKGIQSLLGAPLSSAAAGAVTAAVPGAVLPNTLSQAEVTELNRQAASRAYDEAQRRKTEALLPALRDEERRQAEMGTVSRLNEAIPAMLKKAQKKK